MLSFHKSQQSWQINHQQSDYINSMKRFAAMRGSEIDTVYAEGFRQHLRQGYPQNIILQEILPGFVVLR